MNKEKGIKCVRDMKQYLGMDKQDIKTLLKAPGVSVNKLEASIFLLGVSHSFFLNFLVLCGRIFLLTHLNLQRHKLAQLCSHEGIIWNILK